MKSLVRRLWLKENRRRFVLKLMTDDAIVQFQEMVKRNSHDIRALNGLGNAFASTGRLDEAIRSFESAVKENPGDVDSHNNLGIALTDKGRLQEALNHFQEALRLNPDSTVARSYLESAKAGKR